jgi:HAD superfamily hydrolase (TIGR01509 family)
MTDKLPAGKVPWDVVGKLLKQALPAEVHLGPALGEDAALVEIGGELWAVASDPISFTATGAGRLAVIVNANDVAVRGARPRFFLAVALIAPHEATAERVQELLLQVRDACDEVGAILIGGHTEVTPGLPHSILVGTMLGRVVGRPLTTGGLRVGDHVGMTRSAGIEGTAILLSEFRRGFCSLHGESFLEHATKKISDDWLLVAPEALRAAECKGVSALHDVTEGGVGEALYEMATASGLTVAARREDVPVLPETATICSDLSIDPLGIVGSGALLVGCDQANRAQLEAAMADGGVPFTWIGRAVAAENGNDTPRLPRFSQDEILKAGILEGIEAVVFDMDGTLIDSKYDWPAIRNRLGVTGSSIIDSLNTLPEDERKVRWGELETTEAAATRDARLHDGVDDLLRLLADRRLQTALVTNNTDENTGQLLRRFGLSFDVVLTRDSGLWKPSGAPLVEATRLLGVTPDRCLAVGDSHYDIIAAREAGLAKVCVLHDGTGRYDGATDVTFPDIPAFIRYLRVVVPSP